MKYIALYRQEARCFTQTLTYRLTLEGLMTHCKNQKILSMFYEIFSVMSNCPSTVYLYIFNLFSFVAQVIVMVPEV